MILCFQRVHGVQCCFNTPNNKKNYVSHDRETPQILKLAVSGVTELLRLFSPSDKKRCLLLYYYYAPALSLFLTISFLLEFSQSAALSMEMWRISRMNSQFPVLMKFWWPLNRIMRKLTLLQVALSECGPIHVKRLMKILMLNICTKLCQFI